MWNFSEWNRKKLKNEIHEIQEKYVLLFAEISQPYLTTWVNWITNWTWFYNVLNCTRIGSYKNKVFSLKNIKFGKSIFSKSNITC